MIIFSSPKPFTEKTRPVQLTAIRSWRRALPAARCILFGNEDGLPEICRSEAIEYGGPAETDAGGFKIISKIFQHACRLGPGEIAVFVNSDILLDASAQAALELLERFPGPFLATARRRCLPAWTGPALAAKDLDSFLEARRHPVRWGSACALDIFLFRGFPLQTMPDFRIGQAAWDNWMIFQARWHGIPAIDLSRMLRPFHCDHDYSYVRKNPDPQRPHSDINRINHDLLKGDQKKFHMGHCDHEFVHGHIVRKKGMAFLQRELELWRLRRPEHEGWIKILRSLFRPWFRSWERHTTRNEDWNEGGPPGWRPLAVGDLFSTGPVEQRKKEATPPFLMNNLPHRQIPTPSRGEASKSPKKAPGMLRALRRSQALAPLFYPYYRLKSWREIQRYSAASDPFLDEARGVIHVGAHNRGEILEYAKRRLHVLWVEANPEIFGKLLANLRGIPRQRALLGLIGSEDRSQREFYVASNDGASSSIFKFDQHDVFWPEIRMEKKLVLPQFTLPHLLARAGIPGARYDTLVMDVQGAELEILKGIPSPAQSFPRLQIEAANFSLYHGAPCLSEIDRFLKGEGYVLSAKQVFATDEAGRQCMDCRYLRADLSAQERGAHRDAPH